MNPIQAIKKSNEKLLINNLQDRRVRQQSKFKLGNYFEPQILKESLARVIVQIGGLYYIQLLRSYMMPNLAAELTIYQRDLTRTY